MASSRADAEADDLSQPTGSRVPYYLLGGVAVAGLVAFLAFGGGDDPPKAPVDGTAEASAVSDPSPAGSPKAEETDARPKPSPNANPTPDPDPDPPSAPAEKPQPVANGMGFATNSPAYMAAEAEYQSSGSAESLLSMVLEACKMDDGPRARAAFRKLGPTELRKRAYVACREVKINVRADAKGPTAAELVRRAQRLLDAGDTKLAFETARAANRMERRADAVVVMGIASCSQGETKRAEGLLRHLGPEATPTLVDGCKAVGVALTPTE